jgi:hypothetical protein
MKNNLGSFDRIFRIVLAGGAFIAGLTNWSWWGLLGFVPLVTALAGYCPLYSLLPLKTCKPAKGKPAASALTPPARPVH